MKLMFLLPGDKITLLEDGIIEKKSEDYTIFRNWDFVPKGTTLRVSQVYIRKNGWYDSSITFSFVSGAGLDSYKKTYIEAEKYSLFKMMEFYEVEKNYIKNNNADYYCTSNCNNKKYFYKGTTDEAREKIKNGLHTRMCHIDDVNDRIEEYKERLKNIDNIKIKRNLVMRVFLSEIVKWDVDLIKK